MFRLSFAQKSASSLGACRCLRRFVVVAVVFVPSPPPSRSDVGYNGGFREAPAAAEEAWPTGRKGKKKIGKANRRERGGAAGGGGGGGGG